MNGSTKKLIAENLRNWYFVDSVLLNGHAKHVITDDKDYREYLNLKAALMSNIYEFYTHIGYKSKGEVYTKDSDVQRAAVTEAKKSKLVSAKMIQENDFKKSIKNQIVKEFKRYSNKVDESQHNKLQSLIAEHALNERFLKMCLDNVLLAEPIIKCLYEDKISDFKGSLLEQSHLTIRNEIVALSKKYNPLFLKKSLNEISKFALAKGAFGVFLGYKMIESVAKSIEAADNSCKNRCGRLGFNTSSKKGCILKCKIQTQQRIISALRQSAAQTNNEDARKKFARDVKKAQMQMTKYQRELADLTANRRNADDNNPDDGARLI